MAKVAAKSAMNEKAAAATAKEKPKTIPLSDEQEISLLVLVEGIKAKRIELANMEVKQQRILARIETANGLETGTLAKEYQIANGELVRIVG